MAKMRSLYVVGTAGSGKTAICVAVALKAQELGHRVAYFKPVGSAASAVRREDSDAILMKELLQMEEPLSDIVPLTVTSCYFIRYQRTAEHLARIKENYRRLAERADVVVVEAGPTVDTMMSIGLDAATIATELKAKALLVSRSEDDCSLDHAFFLNRFLLDRGVEVVGTIFNNVPKQVLDKTRGVYQPLMEAKGYPVLGIIPAQRELTIPTVREIWDILGGELLEGEEHLDRRVEDILIGAMTLDSAVTYFRRSINKAVVTGGDRTGIAMAALETNTSVLILTGDLYPDVKVIAKAHEKGVPVLLVPMDTYSTVQRLYSVVRKLRPGDTASIDVARRSFEEHCEWQRLFRALEETGV